jgi:hypothetical protein
VLLVPPGEVGGLVAGESFVEALKVGAAQGPAGVPDPLVALGDRRLAGLAEVEAGGLGQERPDRVQGRGRILDPGRGVDPAGLLGPLTVSGQEGVELSEPGRSVREIADLSSYVGGIGAEQGIVHP